MGSTEYSRSWMSVASDAVTLNVGPEPNRTFLPKIKVLYGIWALIRSDHDGLLLSFQFVFVFRKTFLMCDRHRN